MTMKMLKPLLSTLPTALRVDRVSYHRTRGRTLARLRHRTFTRDCGLCVPCSQAGRTTPATELDHVVPLHKGGTDADDNLQAICTECHRKKTALEQGKTPRATIGRDGWPIT